MTLRTSRRCEAAIESGLALLHARQWLVLAVAGVLLCCGVGCDRLGMKVASSRAGANESHAPKRAALALKGMSCQGCAMRIQSTLRAIDGVLEATVVFDQRRADVQLDTGKTSVQALIDAVNALGYKAEEILALAPAP